MEMNLDAVKKNVCRKAAKAVKMYVTPIIPGWPPTSSGNFYQAKRPTTLRMDNNIKEGTNKQE